MRDCCGLVEGAKHEFCCFGLCFVAGTKDEDCGAEADMQQAGRRRSKPPSFSFVVNQVCWQCDVAVLL